MTESLYRAIVIGTSSGGLEALTLLFKCLPANFPLPIIAVSHRLPVPDSYLTKLLGNTSTLPVQDAENFADIKPGNIYIAPPCYHLLIADDFRFNLTTDPLINSSRPAIDVTFETAAEVYGKGLIGILLTGANTDGARGLLKIKQEQGYTIVQDPKTAVASIMPRSAIELAKPDFIGSVAQIASHLCELCGVKALNHA